jgi:hypothetical protein
MEDELKETVAVHHKVLFGDPSDLKNNPGIVHEQTRLADRQEEANKILFSVQGDIRWIVRLLLGGFVTAVMAMVYKGLH